MILVDTGFFVALANTKDSCHESACLAQEKYAEPLITTWPVITETCHLLLYHLSVDALLAFIKAISQGVCHIHEIKEESFFRIYALMKKYSDLPMDLADASLVILAEELGEDRIFSTDERDFKTYRWKNTKPFKNLLVKS